MTTVRAAITQTTWTGDKDSMLDKHEQFARDAAAQGAQVICFQELFYGPYFGITEDKKYYRYAEPADGPIVQRFAALAAGAEPGHDPPDLRGGHHRRVLQHGRRRRCRRHDPRQVPQAPPAAPGPVLGEVLLPPRQPRLPGVRHGRRQDRRLHLLRPALPRRLARARSERRAHGVQPERDQARSVEPPLGGRGAVRRGRERLLRAAAEPGRTRGQRVRRARGRLLRHQPGDRPARQLRRRARLGHRTRRCSSATSTWTWCSRCATTGSSTATAGPTRTR